MSRVERRGDLSDADLISSVVVVAAAASNHEVSMAHQTVLAASSEMGRQDLTTGIQNGRDIDLLRRSFLAGSMCMSFCDVLIERARRITFDNNISQ